MRSILTSTILLTGLFTNTQKLLYTAQLSNVPVRINDYREVTSHRLSSVQPIRVAQESGIFRAVELELVVDATGAVVRVEVIRGPSEFREVAIAEAKSWTYQPFERAGKAMPAQFSEYIRLLPPEKLPKVHVPFPEIHDWNSLRMTLRRSACYGACPVYSVEISGNGSVAFTGVQHVMATGEQYSQISQDAVAQILEAFRRADYFSLEDDYRYPVTDNPTQVTSISFDGHSKSVKDYVGEYAGMPHAVAELEMTIDRLAGTEEWISGRVQTGKKP